MQLSKLEIKGFKSFADKIVINFDKGITGVVGPNGCGKSNIVDAIRWVLGEQKISMLRSEKMENIIFNGTQKRQPLNLAEVSLTINNTKNIIATEYSQITITRRLYRSGESEYLLNNVVCRLKDITSLFLDTGISSDSYAIIELGMVDDLLNDRDNARRSLFEEAAGISKFKKRKKETLRKLEATDADLERVEDLLFEIKKNMKSLEKQAQQTNTYYEIKKEYQQKSIQLAKLVVKKQKKQFDDIHEQVALKNDDKTKLITDIATTEASIATQKNELEKQEKELSKQQKTVNEYINNIRLYENEKQIKSERLQSLHHQVDRLKKRIEEDKKSNDNVYADIHRLKIEKETAQNLVHISSKKVEVEKKEYEKKKESVLTLQHTVEELQAKYRKDQDESYRLNKELEIRKIQISSLTQEANNTNTDTDQKSASITDFENKLIVLETEITEKNKQIEACKQKESITSETIASLEKDIDITREKLTTTDRKLDACKNEYQLTKSLVENMEGFPEAIKFIKKNIKWAEKAPLLSDVLSTSEQYRITIENYLEPYLNYYIVPSKIEALEAINTLNSVGKGKANFFLLAAFEHFTPLEAQDYPHAFPAIQIIEYDKQYEKLMHYILNKVYVHTGTLDDILPQDDNVFITPNGGITKKQFSLAGGSIGLFEGKKIGRRKNLEKLTKEMQELTLYAGEVRENLLDQQQQLEKLKNNTIRDQIEKIQQEIKMINDEFISLKTKKEQFLNMLDTAGLRQEAIQEKIKNLHEEIEKITPQAKDASSKLAQQEQELNQVLTDLRNHNDMLTQQNTLVNEQQILFHQQENKIKSIEQEIEFKEETIKQNGVRIQNSTEELEKNENSIKEIIASKEHDDKTLIGMYTKKEDMENILNNIETKYYSIKKENDELDNVLRKMQHQRQDIDGQLMELQNELSENKLSLNSMKERLSVEFKVQLDEIMEQTNDQAEESIPSEDTLRDQINKVKNKMEKMEPINPMAMEAYNEIKERNDFIAAQKEDLENAKKSLLSTVNEIEEVANQAFMEAFQKIKGHFVEVFRSLFREGDECDLILANPDKSLESKIDIVAKPKGKRPLTINQLSGGEKTLTAIALLFSIYLLKPAPFCIFDEVDAPLDDANIDKFNTITRNFSKDSQFIVVTHNKRTMTSTDVIYGITMIEEGVSKVVAVDLKEFA